MEFLVHVLSIKTILYHFNWGIGYDLSYIEAIGTVFGLLCIWYASKEKRFNFYYGLINVTLFAIIFYQIQLYANLLLQVFFFVMNIYGLYAWGRDNGSDELKIHWLSRRNLFLTIIISIIAIIGLTNYINQFFGGLTVITIKALQLIVPNLTMPELQPDPYPLMDSAVTVLSVVAMILMTRKVVENWLIWVLIDLISIGLYALQGVYFMALEYVILTFIALNGSIEWIKAAKAQK